jgi:hypothetical protein
MPASGVGQAVAEGVTAIGTSVDGHGGLDLGTVSGEEGQGLDEEGAGALLPLVRQDLGVGEARGLVDGLQMLPACADDAVAPIAGDAVALPGDAPASWR